MGGPCGVVCVGVNLALTPAVHGRNGPQFLVSRVIWVHRSPVQAQNQRYCMVLGVSGSGVGGHLAQPSWAGWLGAVLMSQQVASAGQ